jgi:heme-degrading monooxygenase HmoA
VVIYTLFFNRYRDDLVGERREAYEAHSAAVYQRAVERHPGFVDLKSFVAEDGERLVVVSFRDLEAQNAWRDDAFHVTAQEGGRTDYYEEYRIVVCDELRGTSWKRSSGRS